MTLLQHVSDVKFRVAYFADFTASIGFSGGELFGLVSALLTVGEGAEVTVTDFFD